MAEHDHLCFADFEFTCGGGVGRTGCEMLSVGIIVCDEKYNITDTYYSTARPAKIHKMSRHCRELTKLTQEEINSSDDSNNVLKNVVSMIKKYDIKKLYVWGNFDKPGLISDMNAHIRMNKNSEHIQTISTYIRDIQEPIIHIMDLPQAVSIEELAPVCGYTPEHGSFHNAYNDAMALYYIHKAAYTADMASNDSFIQLKKERIDKLLAKKNADEERRLQLAFSISMSAEERNFYNNLSTDELKHEYILLRYNIIKVMNKFPNENDFVMVIFMYPGSIKVIPECNYDPNRGRSARQVVRFSRYSFGDSLVKVCTKYRSSVTA